LKASTAQPTAAAFTLIKVNHNLKHALASVVLLCGEIKAVLDSMFVLTIDELITIHRFRISKQSCLESQGGN